MKLELSFFLLFVVISFNVKAQDKADNTSLEKGQWNYGLTVSPQMLFIGGLDMGGYINYEYSLPNNSTSFIVGTDIRNKWVQANISNSGLDTKSLKTHYSVNVITYGGVGYSVYSKNKQKRNSLYITGTPYFFSFKESVSTSHIENTVKENSLNFNAGILWTNSKTTKKGRITNTQFYIPILGGHLLDELRVMNFKIGFSI